MTTTTKRIKSPASKAMTELAIRCRQAGMSYRGISTLIPFGSTTISRWCNPEQAKRNRERAAYHRKNNPDKVQQRIDKWRDKNADIMADHRHQKYLEHQDKCLQRQADYRNNNREKVRACLRAYFKTDAGIAASRLAASARRFRKQNTPELVFLDGEWLEVDREETWRVFSEVLLPKDERVAIKELYLESQLLTEETGVEHHVDHLQPLSKGGEHRLINLQILSADENMSKGNNFRKEDQELLCKRLFNETW